MNDIDPDSDRFWMVFGGQGTGATVKHPTLEAAKTEAAKTEAERLAKKHKTSFYVLAAVAKCQIKVAPPLYGTEPPAPVVRRRETKVAGGVVLEEWTKTGYSRSFCRPEGTLVELRTKSEHGFYRIPKKDKK